MPKSQRMDHARLAAALKERLQRGPSSAAELYRPMGISQATFSRTVKLHAADLVVAGRASTTRYALRRAILGVDLRVPVFEIDDSGRARPFGELQAVHPRGFYLRSADESNRPSRFFDDLPYFLDDLRPSGFLGRLIPRRHPDLGAPKDVRNWTADDCLRYLTRYGTDLVGNLILGEGAFRRYLEQARRDAEAIAPGLRETEYPKRAQAVLEHGDPGSSAGGEQPKFSATVGPGRTPVFVKFSPTIDNEIARRRADLLVCEHLALEAMRRAGRSAARSELVFGADQAFLEVERFDRLPPRGRRGLISLFALDAEFVGLGLDWTSTAERLLEARSIEQAVRDEIRWRELFGHLIANTDMHPANLSFFFEEPRVSGLAPGYDMLPMLYAPQNEQLVMRRFDPPAPGPGDADLWAGVHAAAARFWEDVAADDRVSAGMRELAAENSRKVGALGEIGKLLP